MRYKTVKEVIAFVCDTKVLCIFEGKAPSNRLLGALVVDGM